MESVGEYKFLGGVLVTTFSVVDFGSLAVAQDKRDAAIYADAYMYMHACNTLTYTQHTHACTHVCPFTPTCMHVPRFSLPKIARPFGRTRLWWVLVIVVLPMGQRRRLTSGNTRPCQAGHLSWLSVPGSVQSVTAIRCSSVLGGREHNAID